MADRCRNCRVADGARVDRGEFGDWRALGSYGAWRTARGGRPTTYEPSKSRRERVRLREGLCDWCRACAETADA